MKDNEKLLDAIGEANEEHVPDMMENASDKPAKTISKTRKIVIAYGACAAVLVGSIAMNDMINKDVPITDVPSSSYAGEHDSSLEISSTASESSNTEQSEPDTPQRKPLTDEEYNQLLEEHRIYPEISDIVSENTELASITSNLEFGGMGYEAYSVHDISELDTINPWSADKPLDSLPVYKNLAKRENCMEPAYLSQEQMEKMINDAAHCLGLEVASFDVWTVENDGLPLPEELENWPCYILAECNGEKYGVRTVRIRVDGRGIMGIEFYNDLYDDQGMRLPDGYRFAALNTTEEQAIASMEYLADEFKGLLQFENPAVYSCGACNIYGEQERDYYVYDKREDYKQDILSYNFTNTWFCSNESDNKLRIIWLHNPLPAAENLGEYPIIDAQEATELLLNGSYITASPEDFLTNGRVTTEAIAKTELIYRTTADDAYYQPYYKFYVEFAEEYWFKDMKEYGVFYVPAVESKYLSDISVWDGILF